MKNLMLILITTVSISVSVVDVSLAAPKSEALQIAKAGGLKKLRDVPREKLEAAIRKRPDMTTSNVITTIAVGTEVFSQQTGWSLASETAALGVLTVLSALPTHEPEMHTRLLVWLPRTHAGSREEAAAQFRDIVVAAFREALPEYTVKLDTKYFAGYNDGEYRYLAVRNSECSDCGVYSRPIFHHLRKPKTKRAPKLLGGYDAYHWSVGGLLDARIDGFPMEATNLAPEERLNILTKVSKQLPKWVYVYVAPAENMAGFPILLNEGKPMFFIEPDENRQ